MATMLHIVCQALALIVALTEEVRGVDTLLMTSLVFRHGDRSAIDTFPSNTCDETCWRQGFGQLSQRGMRQHYILGQYLRHHYRVEHPLLNSSYYFRSQIHIRSTDVDRTLMSAESQLSSFYPPEGFQQFEPSLPWMPLPVHTVPAHNDSLLRAYDTADNACPRYTKLYNDIPTLPEYMDQEAQHSDFIKWVGEKSGVDYELTLQNIYKVEDPLFCQREHDLPLPSWANNTVVDRMHMLGGISMGLMFQTKEMHKLTAGVLINEMIVNMKNKSKGEQLPTERAFVYSAHDTTVTALLSALEIYNEIQPPYASCVMIELYKPDTGGEDYIKVLYRNVTTSNDSAPFDLTPELPGCVGKSVCTLTDFHNYYKDISVVNWYNACHDSSSSMPLSRAAVASISVAAVFAVATMVLLITLIARSPRRSGYKSPEC